MLYAIVGVWSVVAPTAIFGFVYQGMQFLGRSPDTYVGWYFSEYLDRVSWGLWLLTTVGCFVLVGIVGAAAVFVEAWWNYTLVHEQRDRFVATRGLLTTRSFTVDQSRLRGVTVAEALTTRVLRGARLMPILTGVSADQQNKESGVLVPTTTRDVPVSLANTLLGETVLTPDRLRSGWLRRHPAGGPAPHLVPLRVCGGARGSGARGRSVVLALADRPARRPGPGSCAYDPGGARQL